MLKWINNNLSRSSTNKKTIVEEQSDELETYIDGMILDYEYLCQSEKTSHQLIAELMKIYSKAVQYYESRNDSRYLLYRKRMEHFLKKQNVDDVLRGKSTKLIHKRQTAQKQIIQAKIRSSSQVSRLLDRSEQLTGIYESIIQKNIKNQQMRLDERIKIRRAMSSRSSRTRDDDDNQEPQYIGKKMDYKFICDEIYQRRERKDRKVFI